MGIVADDVAARLAGSFPFTRFLPYNASISSGVISSAPSIEVMRILGNKEDESLLKPAFSEAEEDGTVAPPGAFLGTLGRRPPRKKTPSNLSFAEARNEAMLAKRRVRANAPLLEEDDADDEYRVPPPPLRVRPPRRCEAAYVSSPRE